MVFLEKWGVPKEAYQESMLASKENSIEPRWYVVLDSNNTIIAGAGLIDNDFHEHPQFTPNICALYVEKEFRGQQIARKLLKHVELQLSKQGCESLYLITDHKELYEKLGWSYLKDVTEEDGNHIRIYCKRMLF